jgi:Ca2+-transporting ATPase
MQILLGKHWHQLLASEVIKLLETDIEIGLDIFEIKHRQERFGSNIITENKKKSSLAKFLQQFNNPLIYILLASSAITALIKDLIDALIILGVVLINAIIGYIQEAKAEQAIEALAESMNTEATVIRSKKTIRISAAELIPGDVVLLKSGDKVPADLRLVRSRDLQIAEAALTGESMPVEKDATIQLDPDVTLADRKNMAFASTLVTYGQGTGIVTAIGNDTEVGRISKLISSASELNTPLTKKITRFSQIVLYVILGLAAIAFTLGVIRGQAWIDTLTAAIALAVAMIPEGLPAAMTITLAIGVSRMARRRAIIRKLPAVEALGSTTVICSDKTGTLTQNQMTVQGIHAHDSVYRVTGNGYKPEGKIQLSSPEFLDEIDLSSDHRLHEILIAGLLCNDSELIEENGSWQAHGDPTEVALIVAARKAFLNPQQVRIELPRLDSIPFESQHQYMASLHARGPNQPAVIYIKGSLEAILERCTQILDKNSNEVPLDKAEIQKRTESMASEGMRVLAFARKYISLEITHITHKDVAFGLTFLGLQGMIDPPRRQAINAVRACQDAGIGVKMITGDHPLTASAIARQIGLFGYSSTLDGKPKVLTGKEMAALTDEQLIDATERTAVFARVSPEQKLRLVEALQARNQVVAMTGDGVNDGPALKQSDIGIAMGITGTDVAKEAADMILTDDNFATIEAAIEEGRGVFDNLTKIITWTLPTNLGQGLIILAALIVGVALPIMPIQVLWINMTTVALLGTVLALEPKEPGVMKRSPRNPQAPILTRELLWRVVLVGALILAGSFGLYEYELAIGATVNEARTVAVNAVVVINIFYLLNCRSLSFSMFKIGVFSNRWVILGILGMLLLQIFFTYTPATNQILYTFPIGLESWGRVFLVGLAGYLLVETDKWLRQKVRKTSA